MSDFLEGYQVQLWYKFCHVLSLPFHCHLSLLLCWSYFAIWGVQNCLIIVFWFGLLGRLVFVIVRPHLAALHRGHENQADEWSFEASHGIFNEFSSIIIELINMRNYKNFLELSRMSTLLQRRRTTANVSFSDHTRLLLSGRNRKISSTYIWKEHVEGTYRNFLCNNTTSGRWYVPLSIYSRKTEEFNVSLEFSMTSCTQQIDTGGFEKERIWGAPPIFYQVEICDYDRISLLWEDFISQPNLTHHRYIKPCFLVLGLDFFHFNSCSGFICSGS